MKIDPNDSAFPLTESTNAHGNMAAINDSCAYIVSSGGLTIRAHFAALAMQAMLANPYIGDALTEEEAETPLRCAELAVEAADALIQALNK